MRVRVAITGGTGFVGTHLAALLRTRGHELVLVARGRRPARAGDGVRTARGDVVTGEGLDQAFAGCDAVVHLAAVIVEKGSQTLERVNHGGCAHTARAARDAGVAHLVHLSAVGAGPDPRYAYLRSKWAGEQAILLSGVPVTILRSSLIFGPGDGFFTRLALLARLTPPFFPIPVAGDGRALFSPISVGDVALCIALSLERGPAMRTIEIGGPEQLTYARILEIVRGEVTRLPRPLVRVPVPLIRPVAAAMAALLPNPLVTPGQLDLLSSSNITTTQAVASAFGFQPASFTESCAYLRERGT